MDNSRIIAILRSAVEHRERVSFDDIDCANLLNEFKLLQGGLDAAYLRGYSLGREAMKAECVALCEDEFRALTEKIDRS